MLEKYFQGLIERISHHEFYTIQTKLVLRHNVALTKTMLLLQTDTKHKIPVLLNATLLASNTLELSAT